MCLGDRVWVAYLEAGFLPEEPLGPYHCDIPWNSSLLACFLVAHRRLAMQQKLIGICGKSREQAIVYCSKSQFRLQVPVA